VAEMGQDRRRTAPTPWHLSDDVAARQLYRRHGLPNLIEGYAAFDDILTRITPFLMVVFVVNIVTSTINHGAWGALAGIALGIGIVFAVHAIIQRFGPPQIALWLIVPFVVRWFVGGASLLRSAVWLLINLGILAAATLFATFGVGSMTLWAFRQIRMHTRSVTEVIIKTLPLLLLTVLFFFFGAEAWQLMHHLQTARFIGGLSAFVVFGSVLPQSCARQTMSPGSTHGKTCTGWQAKPGQRICPRTRWTHRQNRTTRAGCAQTSIWCCSSHRRCR
jgi:hypothetical protein